MELIEDALTKQNFIACRDEGHKTQSILNITIMSFLLTVTVTLTRRNPPYNDHKTIYHVQCL